MEFIEALLETLGHNDNKIRVKQMHGISLKVLDVFYLSRNQVLAKLRKTSGASERPAAIEADLMLLAASLIAASSFILDQSKSDYIIDHLSRITCIVKEDILSFASILLEQVLSDDED